MSCQILITLKLFLNDKTLAYSFGRNYQVSTSSTLPRGGYLIGSYYRALTLWEADPTLLIALEVAKAFVPCVEFMMVIWPSPSEPDLFDSSLSSHVLKLFPRSTQRIRGAPQLAGSLMYDR